MQTFSGVTSYPLVANRLYDIKLEFKEVTGLAAVRLLWKSATQPLTLIPSYRLFYNATAAVQDSPYSVTTVR
jgi:hypothetical protein